MNAFRTLALVAVASAVSTASFAADLDTTRPMTGKLLVASSDATITRRVEYCLRNMPELTELLTLAHATYSQASTEAAFILERKFPASEYTIHRARIETSAAKASEFDLKQAHSRGFQRLCPELIVYMHNATGESLAKTHGDLLFSLQKQFASGP